MKKKKTEQKDSCVLLYRYKQEDKNKGISNVRYIAVEYLKNEKGSLTWNTDMNIHLNFIFGSVQEAVLDLTLNGKKVYLLDDGDHCSLLKPTITRHFLSKLKLLN